ncbi:hypothetical protein [Nocardia grenadensis]|uniref:hypothetical protein n=1 Tax=Nocardia grenadensis TaxID=931537 RepID=UPI000B1048EE|nr:hypothetical protein [Nocardia grenadensis]
MSNGIGKAALEAVEALTRSFNKAAELIANKFYRGGAVHPTTSGAKHQAATDSGGAATVDDVLVREVRTRAGLPPEYQGADIREVRSRDRRQIDDIHENRYGLGNRPLGTERADFTGRPLRGKPATDLKALLDQARTADGGARLVIGGGHRYRPAEPGEIFANVNPNANPDVLADFRDLSVFPDSVFDEVNLERVPLLNTLEEGGAAEIHRVLKNDGRLVIGTGLANIAPATERAANVRALEAAGFRDIDVVAARDDMMDADERFSDWYEMVAIKADPDGAPSK